MVGLSFRVVSPGNLTHCSGLAGEILCMKPKRRLIETSRSLLCMKPKRRLTQQWSSFVQSPRGGYGEPSVILSYDDINKHEQIYEQVYMTKCVCA